MYFATPLPWWLALLLAAGVAGVASLSYRRPLVPLSRAQHTTLVTLRAVVLFDSAAGQLQTVVTQQVRSATAAD